LCNGSPETRKKEELSKARKLKTREQTTNNTHTRVATSKKKLPATAPSRGQEKTISRQNWKKKIKANRKKSVRCKGILGPQKKIKGGQTAGPNVRPIKRVTNQGKQKLRDASLPEGGRSSCVGRGERGGGRSEGPTVTPQATRRQGESEWVDAEMSRRLR